jgi:hypothetical protein
MRRGVQFDTLQPQGPATSAQKPKFAGDSRTAPGPDIAGCAECGDAIGPWWSEAGETFCRDHAPADLKFAGAAR